MENREPARPSFRRVATALASALLIGVGGWVAIPCLWGLLTLLVPASRIEGEWFFGGIAGASVALVPWSALLGAAVAERRLGLPRWSPSTREGWRGWLSLLLCTAGLLAGCWASGWTILSSGPFGLSALLDITTPGVEPLFDALCTLALIGTSPTVALLAARMLCRRWLRRVPPGADAGAALSGTADRRAPVPAVPPPSPRTEPPLLPATA